MPLPLALSPALIPLGVSLARISRNTAEDDNHIVIPKKDRGRAIIDKMTKGGASAPITEWSEQKLEKAIRRNSMFRAHADELRAARVNGAVSAAKESSPKADQELNIPETKAEPIKIPTSEKSLSQADLLLLAAESACQANPVRDSALELLADNSFDAILITDTDGIIAYSNKAFSKLTGYEQSEIIGKSPKLLQGPGTDRKVLNRLKESMEKGRGDYEGSAINYKKDGTPFIMHWRVVPVKVGGEIKAWVAIQREGTESE